MGNIKKKLNTSSESEMKQTFIEAAPTRMN